MAPPPLMLAALWGPSERVGVLLGHNMHPLHIFTASRLSANTQRFPINHLILPFPFIRLLLLAVFAHFPVYVTVLSTKEVGTASVVSLPLACRKLVVLGLAYRAKNGARIAEDALVADKEKATSWFGASFTRRTLVDDELQALGVAFKIGTRELLVNECTPSL